MKQIQDENMWFAITKKHSIVFLNPNKNATNTRFDIDRVEQYFEGTALYLVKLKFSKKHAIYNANTNKLSPKFTEFVYSIDNKHFIVSIKKLGKLYQTIYYAPTNEFLSVTSEEIIPISNSNAYAIKLPEQKDKITCLYQIYNTNSYNLYGKFVQFDRTALANYIRVKKELGWQTDTWLLNLETGKMIISDYERKLYAQMERSTDVDSVDYFAQKTATLTPEHLLYCIPELAQDIKKEQKATATKKVTNKAKKQNEEIVEEEQQRE